MAISYANQKLDLYRAAVRFAGESGVVEAEATATDRRDAYRQIRRQHPKAESIHVERLPRRDNAATAYSTPHAHLDY